MMCMVCYSLLFVRSRYMFEFSFELHSGDFVIHRLISCQRHRASAFGIFSTCFGVVMIIKSFGQIVGDTGVIGMICTLEYIGVSHGEALEDRWLWCQKNGVRRFFSKITCFFVCWYTSITIIKSFFLSHLNLS